jgi:hypothetical protein
MAPAFGGRGIERDPTELVERIEPGFGDDDTSPCGIRGPPMELRVPFPGLDIPRLTPICAEPILLRPAGVLRTLARPLRFAVGGFMWLTTGRAKLRDGVAAGCPALAPSIVVRVGRTSGERTADSDVRLNWVGETRTEFRATGSEFTSVFREAAVNPFGARRFA